MKAVEQNGYCLKDASTELQKGEFVMEAVKTNTPSGALKWASNEIKNYRKIILTAIKHDASEIIHASDILKKNNEIIIAALSHARN